MRNNKKKIMAILMLVVTIISSMQSLIFASTEISNATVYEVQPSELHLQYWNADKGMWYYVTTNYIGYNYNGKVYPAYCLNREFGGVDEYGSYTVSVTEALSDVRVWRAILSGFPYKSASELGVENDLDAYVATKQAVYSILYGRDVRSFYRGGDYRGELIVNAMERIVNEGRYGTRTPQSANLTISKIGELKEEGVFYTQEYKVESIVRLDNYYISNTANLPEGSYISDSNGTARTSFNGNENFKVYIPKEKMNNDISSLISLQAKCEKYPMFYGKAPNSNYQNYALTFDPLGDEQGNTNLNIQTNTGKLEINKIDEETKTPISGVVFEIKNTNGDLIGTFTTDRNGKILVSNLYQGKYSIKEISTADEYIYENIEEVLDVEFNKQTNTTITNKHKKGNLKITKVDLDEPELTLGGVEFELLDSKGEVIKNLVTDADGEIFLENINTGNYILREIKTKKEYEISADIGTTVNWNETTNLTVTNEKKKGQIRIIKVDLDDNEVKLSNVTFEIYNNKGNLVETLVTDQNGIAISSRLPIGDYTIKETITQSEYVLNEEKQVITLERNQIKDITFTNEKIKGQIEITKVAQDDNMCTGDKEKACLKDAVYEIYNSKGEIVDTITTDENGKAITDLLVKGVYTIKEVKAPEYYLIDEKIYTAQIKENKEIVRLELENKSVEVGVEITKKGYKETQSKDTIFYNFEGIKNTSNVELDNFTWQDVLPINALRVNRIYTGTWSEELEYEVWYKTNLNDYKILKDKLSTKLNNKLDFKEINLDQNEFITEFEFRFGTVESGFTEIEKPILYCDMLENLGDGFIFTNNTKVSGNYKEKYVEEKDEWNTITYFKELNLKEYELPKTGF